MVHASRGRLEPASDGAPLRGRDRLRARPTRRSTARRAIPWAEFEADYSRVRARIAEVVPGFERFEERLADGFVLPHPPRDELPLPDADGPRAPVGQRARPDSAGRGAPAAPDDALARPVQHDDLRAQRPLPRREGRAAGRAGPPRRPRGARPARRGPRRPRRRVGRRRAARGALSRDELPDRARLRGRVLPGGERPRPARQHGGGQQHARPRSRS